VVFVATRQKQKSRPQQKREDCSAPGGAIENLGSELRPLDRPLGNSDSEILFAEILSLLF